MFYNYELFRYYYNYQLNFPDFLPPPLSSDFLPKKKTIFYYDGQHLIFPSQISQSQLKVCSFYWGGRVAGSASS